MDALFVEVALAGPTMVVEISVGLVVLTSCVAATWIIKSDNAATRSEAAMLAREVSALAATVKELGNLLAETRGKVHTAEHDLTSVRERLAHTESRLETFHGGGGAR